MTVLCGSVRAFFFRISSGFIPQVRMISLRAPILLMRVIGFIDRPEATYIARRNSMPFILMSWYVPMLCPIIYSGRFAHVSWKWN